MRNPKGRYADMSMPYGCLYLNNDGSRWVTQDMRFVLVLADGTRTVRLADCYESFGNFAATLYRYKGKRYSGLAKSNDGYETRDDSATGIDALPHIFHDKSGVRS
jgi:hypothetical protein